jgi:hypothetical protein
VPSPPWSIEDIGTAFVIKDASGQKLIFTYYEDEPGPRSTATQPPWISVALDCSGNWKPVLS